MHDERRLPIGSLVHKIGWLVSGGLFALAVGGYHLSGSESDGKPGFADEPNRKPVDW
jgi:hypothetical protein